MANTVQNVNVGKPQKQGAIFIAPYGTVLPTSPEGALDSAFACLGYVSEDGLTNSSSPESDEIKAWGGDTIYTTQTGKDDTFSLTLVESLNSDVLKAVYGDDNVAVGDDGIITITANSTELTEHSWVVNMTLRNGGIKRIVIPCGKISETGDISYVDDEVIGYEITINASPDKSGNTHYEYIKPGTNEASAEG